MKRRVICILMCALATGLLAVPAGAVDIIQPTEATSKDVFAYQNFSTLNWDGAPFNVFLAAGKTTSGHDTESFIQFDLSGVTYAPAAITEAKLFLYVGDTAASGFGTSPTGASPVLVDMYAITSSWAEGTLTWAARPTIAGAASDSESVSAINQWISFDVKTLLLGWLANPSTNNGVSLVANAVAAVPSTAAVFNSASGVNRPYLMVVPEPASALLALPALAALVWFGRRRGRAAA